MSTGSGTTIHSTCQQIVDFLLFTISSTSARSNLTLKRIQPTSQVVTKNNLAKYRKADGKSNEYSNFVRLLVPAKANTWYDGRVTEVMTMSGSTSKTSVLKSFKTIGQAEATPTPSNNEDRPRNTRRVSLKKPLSQLFKLNETEFLPLVLMIKTSPPLLPTLQKISFMFS